MKKMRTTHKSWAYGSEKKGRRTGRLIIIHFFIGHHLSQNAFLLFRSGSYLLDYGWFQHVLGGIRETGLENGHG